MRRAARLAALVPLARLAALAPLAPLAAPALAATPPRCEVSAELVPARAYVGQQVHYHLRILRRRDVTSLEWETQLSFPTFRAEWLPTLSGDDRAERDGETYLVFLERRAIFAAHPGRLEIPGASLRCSSPDGSEIVRVPTLSLEALDLPSEGRPPGFAGLLGPVALSASASPERLAVGDALTLSVIVQGDTNLWSMPSPRDALARLEDVDVFEQPPQLARDAGRGLVVRRYFAFELVPRRAGVLRLPALTVPYFDPRTGRYGEATAALPALRVSERAAPQPPPETTTSAPASPDAQLRRGAIALAIAAAAGLVAVAVFRGRRRGAGRDELAEHLAEARAAAARGDRDAAARAAAHALQHALAAAPSDGAATEPHGPVPTARRLLAEIERARFGAGGTAPPLAEIEQAIERLAERRARER